MKKTGGVALLPDLFQALLVVVVHYSDTLEPTSVNPIGVSIPRSPSTV